jgi:hypothetical protein
VKPGWRRLIFWRRSAEDQELVAECEAFLSGRYLYRCGGRRGRLPAWVWMSTLAHGDRADIEALADAGTGPRNETGPAQYFARQVLSVVDVQGLSLRSLQRELLVPLELTCDASDSARTSRSLCTRLLLALRRAGAMGEPPPDGPPISEPRKPPDTKQ